MVRSCPNMVYKTAWVLLTRNQALLEREEVKAKGVAPGATTRMVRLWTDDHASLFEILQ